ncbi:YceI family protein [Flagellimonas algicola]|uniref:YceI family protein n=1 Tax=Flagellimonas algicola TaxID=2583815 RepID=A0ABY2WGL8_9FLAO|nr:YceI family protein [Allomuricauda algicola]TMU50709.1 YceI family protein [Allomuricauda algicola]
MKCIPGCKILIVHVVVALTTTFGTAQQHVICEGSNINITGTSTLHDWTLDVKKQAGQITILTQKSKNKVFKSCTLSKLSVSIFSTDVESRKGKTMDNKLHKAIKAIAHPSITFKSTKDSGFVYMGGTKAELIMLSGILGIAGVEKSVQVKVMPTYDGKILGLSGELPIKLSDFNIEPPTAMFGQIETGNDISVNFNLKFENKTTKGETSH